MKEISNRKVFIKQQPLNSFNYDRIQRKHLQKTSSGRVPERIIEMIPETFPRVIPKRSSTKKMSKKKHVETFEQIIIR